MRVPGYPRRRSVRVVLTLFIGLLLVSASAPALAVDPLPGAVDPPGADDRRRLPADLEPSLADASRIRPRAYEGGCHAEKGDLTPSPCELGDTDGAFTVVLIGDSHAVQWLPALEVIAEREGWKLFSMTKSACPLPDVTVTVRGERAPDCPPWRRAALRLIARLHPDLVLAASLGRIYRIPGAGTQERRDQAWRDGWRRSLERLRDTSERVVLLGDTPMWQRDPVRCLRRHRADIGRCDTPRSIALSPRTEAAERGAADDAGVAWVPTTDLVCPTDPCRAVEGRFLVLRDIQHMTVAWARSIGPRLLARLSCDLTPAATLAHGAASATPSAGPPSSPVPSVGASPPPGPSADPSSPDPWGPRLVASSSPSVSCPV